MFHDEGEEHETHEHAHGGLAFAIGAALFAPMWAVAWVLTLPARVWRCQSIKDSVGKENEL